MAYTFKVPDMSCAHCEGAITQAVAQALPAASVRVDLANRQVTVDNAPAAGPVQAAIVDAGYDAELID